MAIAVIILLMCTAAYSATVTIYPTGVNDNFALLAGGASDPHYTQHAVGASQPYPQATVLSSASYYSEWPRPTTGQWIAPGDAFDTGARGWYKFRTTFDLTGLDPTTARIDGLWTCDQYGYIQLNWNDTGNTLSDGDYTSLHQFSVTNGFVSGVNTFDFLVYFPDGGAGVVAPLIICSAADPGPAHLVINEIQSSNSSTIADEDGDHPDWIEIYNAGGQSVNLQGYGLSDDTASPFKWTFPSYVLEANRYLLVFASDKDRKSGPYFHTNYAIKSGGEPIVLTAPDGTTVDELPPISIPVEMSYGRKPDAQSTMMFFSSPTPGRPNFTTGYYGTLTAPLFSRVRGFYTSAFNLTLTSTVSGATIRYTTDGSAPTESSPVYSGPISIPSGTGTSFATTVVRARLFKDGYMPSPVATHTYFVSSNAASKYNLPIVSLVTDSKNFFDSEIGIYVSGNHDNYNQEGDAWERPIHVEFFEPGGPCGFHCDAGVRIQGGWTRHLAQKSLRLYADHQGGPGSFGYKIFPQSTLSDYKRIILRNYGNDNPLETTFGTRYTMMRDNLMQTLVKDLDIDTQLTRQCVVFLNGQYWGLHCLMEREDKYWLQNHHPDIDPDNIDLVQQHPGYVEVDEGDQTAFNSMLSFLRQSDLIVPSNFGYAESIIDVNNVLIHYLTEIYCGNTDWPGNNIRYWRPRTSDGKWRWALCDLDFALGLQTPYTHDTLSFATRRGGSLFTADDVCLPMASLIRNRATRDEFIDRMADMMNTVFLPSYAIAKVDAMQAEISPYVAEYFTRWGAGSISTWNSNVQYLRTFLTQRPTYVRSSFIRFFRLSGTSTLNVNVSQAGAGTVGVSTIATPAGASTWQGTYFNDTPIPLTAIPADGYKFVRWEGAVSGTQSSTSITLSNNATVTAVFEVSK